MELAPKYVMRDNDTKFTAQFGEVFQTSGADIKRILPLSPNLRAHVERFIQSLKQERLDKFVIVAERHLSYVGANGGCITTGNGRLGAWPLAAGLREAARAGHFDPRARRRLRDAAGRVAEARRTPGGAIDLI